MGFRVEKSKKSFLPQYKDHWKKLVASQFQEREENTRKRSLQQVVEISRRAALRTPLVTTSSAIDIPDQTSSSDIDGEEIQSQNSVDQNNSRSPSPRHLTNLLTSTRFKKMPTELEPAPLGIPESQLSSNSGPSPMGGLSFG
ncbi:uncharacterized protein MELLADRAFT_61162 [Melampsora larici-populina 98AG31]|uniref:Uncharacterized protein n=1 Tax=Melampsora larici-populina (strain 98AG31 / pathotype 3-4-7) TaxID=747676 RepID=F4RDU3_MELLP|nr:uncharacterized protein MELLADRAFT_61162 [Melampsora larici-populina 98AG31]EGG09550.1 hypothetical protein MELLADRAFT_61162 [Melampsora larici-populina 98AG31]